MEMNRRQFLPIAAFALSGTTTAANISLRVADSKEYSLAQGITVGREILTAAYKRIDQAVEFLILPLRRSQQMLVNGEIDATLYRFSQFGHDNPELLRLSTPIFHLQVKVYVADGKASITSWGDLRGMRVAFVRGTLVIESKLPPGTVQVESNDMHEVLKQLDRGVAQVGLLLEVDGVAASMEMAGTSTVRRPGNLEVHPAFHYLHPKHRSVAERLEPVLAQMRSSGEMLAIQKRVLKGLS